MSRVRFPSPAPAVALSLRHSRTHCGQPRHLVLCPQSADLRTPNIQRSAARRGAPQIRAVHHPVRKPNKRLGALLVRQFSAGWARNRLIRRGSAAPACFTTIASRLSRKGSFWAFLSRCVVFSALSSWCGNQYEKVQMHWMLNHRRGAARGAVRAPRRRDCLSQGSTMCVDKEGKKRPALVRVAPSEGHVTVLAR